MNAGSKYTPAVLSRPRAGWLVSLALCVACSAPEPDNLLLIVVDTLRRDHLGAYGYPRNTSPAIDAFAADAVRFERAYATSPWTRPSVASMLTGLYPSAHGAMALNNSLASSVHTLAETLAVHGYRTGAVVSHVILSRSFGFDQGFEVYDEEEAQGHDHLSTPGVTSRAIQWIDSLAPDGRPFFLLVHYFDPHYQYRHHPDIGFASPPVGRLDGTESIEELRTLGASLTPDEVGLLRDLYDEEIRFTDEGIGQLLDHLRERGLYDRTLIVLAADHGEEFLERGWLGHTRTLYDELIAVPLLIRHGRVGRNGSSVPSPVSLVSLSPTVLELLGLPLLGMRPEGPSLAAAVRGTEAPPRGVVFAEVDFRAMPEKRAAQRAAIAGRYKLVHDRLERRDRLFDVVADPGELNEVGAREPHRLERLQERLTRWSQRMNPGAVAPPTRPLTPEEREQLRALGYLGPEPDAP
jgi:arylsulfatase